MHPSTNGGAVRTGSIGPTPADGSDVGAGGIAVTSTDGGRLTRGLVLYTSGNSGSPFASDIAPASANGGEGTCNNIGVTIGTPAADGRAINTGRHAVAAVAADDVGAVGVLLRPQSRQGQRVGRRRQRLARGEGHVTGIPGALDSNLQPAGIALEGTAAKVNLRGEQPIGHTDGRGLGDANLVAPCRRRTAASRIPQAELEVAGAADRAAGLLELPLVGEGGAQGGLDAHTPLRRLGFLGPGQAHRQRQQEHRQDAPQKGPLAFHFTPPDMDLDFGENVCKQVITFCVPSCPSWFSVESSHPPFLDVEGRPLPLPGPPPKRGRELGEGKGAAAGGG
jgi:hypothetical protein